MTLKHRKIFSGCVTASTLLHISAFCLLQSFGFWVYSSNKSPSSNWLEQVEKTDRDQILQVAFAEPLSKNKENAPLKMFKTEKEPLTIKLATAVHPFELESSPLAPFKVSFATDQFLISHPHPPSFPLPASSFNLLEYLPTDLEIQYPIQQERVATVPTHLETPITLTPQIPRVDQEVVNHFSFQTEEVSGQLVETGTIGKITPPLPTIDLPKLPSLDELETSSYSDSFETELELVEQEDGKYIFALTLVPKPYLNLEKMNQHFIFLIDKGNSIQQERLHTTKSAIRKALQELSPEDTFNIVAFDSKMEKMAPQAVSPTKKTLAQAEQFLDKIHLGSFFSSSDLYKPLFLTVPGSVPVDEVYTAILLTDSETLGKKGAQRALLNDWTEYNRGKVNLYALAMNHDNHASLLEAASILNKGKCIFSSTNRGLKRKLLKLMKSINTPVAKNISCVAINSSSDCGASLLPFDAPNLYLDQPFVVMGQTDTLDDFILFVQGNLKGRCLNIKKKISFANAKKGSKSLSQEWAVQQAYKLYQTYSIDNNPEHIAEAKNLLEPFNLHLPYR